LIGRLAGGQEDTNMEKTIAIALLSVLSCSAQIVLPEGTKIRVRLDQNISSATAEEGQVVELSVTDAVKTGDAVIVPEGARVTGTITQAHEKRRMGRAGKLDFSIDRVRTADNQWIPLRYTVTKKSGQSHAIRTGILTAGVAVVFWLKWIVDTRTPGSDEVSYHKTFRATGKRRLKRPQGVSAVVP